MNVQPWREEWYRQHAASMTIITLKRNLDEMCIMGAFEENDLMADDFVAAIKIARNELIKKGVTDA